uniref:Putative G-protein coupled receptor 148-like protein n=1 Tax=Callorhinchus milii TaxID=7868 RepID=V9L4B6_CALMI|eukprot:gi/632991670/ref/XP_007884734.1/ PREDICTED: olfactory receptor 11A1-like [Callorhinchus milii]
MNQTANATGGQAYTEVRFYASVASFVLLAFFNLVLDSAILTDGRLRSQARFVLLFHLLLSGVTYFGLSGTFYLLVYSEAPVSVPGCLALLLLLMTSGSTILVTLTMMALDRFLAICHPLAYDAFCNPRRVWACGSLAWLISLVIPLILVSQDEQHGGSRTTTCSSSNLHSSHNKRGAFKIFLICSCTALILYSYAKILVEGKRLGVLNRRNTRAWRTIAMHGAQLVVYIVPAFINFTLQLVAQAGCLRESARELFEVVNFAFFSLAQCLGPVIYGLRKEELWEVTSRRVPAIFWEVKGTLEWLAPGPEPPPGPEAEAERATSPLETSSLA